jgi:Leucine Rich repeat
LKLSANVLGRNPEAILRQSVKWDLLPDHLREAVRRAARGYFANSTDREILPAAIQKIFIDAEMETLNLDGLTGVTNGFLNSVKRTLPLERLTRLSLVNCKKVSDFTLAGMLNQTTNLEYLNVKGCAELQDASMPEKVIRKLTMLVYLSISNTRITGQTVGFFYEHCPHLATLKIAGCRKHMKVTKVFPRQSETLTSLKVRHCPISTADFNHLLELFPNLRTLDASSTDIVHLTMITKLGSELRKVNVSNCRSLNQPYNLFEILSFCPHLEQFYVTKAIAGRHSDQLPDECLARYKTLFLPELAFGDIFLPRILRIAVNLTYLDLSRSKEKFELDSDTPINIVNLRTLSLEGCPITDEGTKTLCRIHGLKSLFLRRTLIGIEGGRRVVYGCPWLEELDVTSCRSIDIYHRRDLLEFLREEFQDLLSRSRDIQGDIITDDNGITWRRKLFSNGEEAKEGFEELAYQNDGVS